MDEDTYGKVKKDPTNKLKAQLTNFAKKAHKDNILDMREARYLIPDAPKKTVIYQIPKIHKNKTHPPGRPIINGIDSIFYSMEEYLDHFLQPIARSFPSYIKDSKELINWIKKEKS